MFAICTVIAPLLVLFSTVSHAGHLEQEPSDESTSIVLDDAHEQAAGHELKDTIRATPSVVLDARSYKLRVPPGIGVDAPNSVHVIHGKGEYYRATWNGQGRVVLGDGTLQVVKGPNRFPGFKSGEKYVIAVGYDRVSTDQKLSFDVIW